MSKVKRFIDIGANLTDSMYSGVYNGSKKHENDLISVLKRSWNVGLDKIIITAGSYTESLKCLELTQNDDRLYMTVGCHPTRCSEFESNDMNPLDYLNKLKNVIDEGKSKVVAIGEFGLDYDRTNFCPKDIQKKYFELQLSLTNKYELPLFLHCRNAAEDLCNTLEKYSNLRGVVHSFDGSLNEAQKFIEMGFYIGLNGCSLKTLENLKTVSELPNDKILLETDAPWCEIRPSHAGYKYILKEHLNVQSVKKEKWNPDCMVKNRNEPSNIIQVLDVIAAVKNENPDELSEIIYRNTSKLFFNNL